MPKLVSEESNTKNRMKETRGIDAPSPDPGSLDNAHEVPSMMRHALDDRSVGGASRMAEVP